MQGFLSQYVSWAIKEGYRESNLNPLKSVDPAWFDDLVDKSKKIHYTIDEFNDLLEKLKNAQDQAFLRLLFEGVSGKSFSEIRNIRFEDVNWSKNSIYIEERDETVEVSRKCIEYLEKAHYQQPYFTFIPEMGKYNERELLQTKYIFKNIKSPRAKEDQPVNASIFYTRLNNIKEKFKLEYLTPNSIRQSGMIYLAMKIFYKGDKFESKDGKFDYEEYAIIGKKFNFPKINNGTYEYYNTTLMGDFLNRENVKELYDLDVPLKR